MYVFRFDWHFSDTLCSMPHHTLWQLQYTLPPLNLCLSGANTSLAQNYGRLAKFHFNFDTFIDGHTLLKHLCVCSCVAASTLFACPLFD